MPVSANGELPVDPGTQCDHATVTAGLPGIADQVQGGLCQLPCVGQEVRQAGVIVTLNVELSLCLSLNQLTHMLHDFMDIGGLGHHPLSRSEHAID